jgi:hypothetical protein
MAMLCPVCGSVAEVKETRTLKKEDLVRRTYQCFGSYKSQKIHKFNTHERVVSVRDKVLPHAINFG